MSEAGPVARYATRMRSPGGFTALLMCERVRPGKMFRHACSRLAGAWKW